MVLVTTLLVGSYYWWEIRSAGDAVVWSSGDLPGYYNYLGRAFASGQLSLPVIPKKELLALPNPWDPVQNDPYRMHDMVLFNGRYYLYHGAGPALIIFAPWRFATGRDFPESAAVAAFCFGAYLFYAGALVTVVARRGLLPSPGVLAMLLLAVGVGNSVPYLCSRVAVYEVAIAGGLFCVAGGICFLCAGLVARNSSLWFAACGLMFGLAISCRPHLVFAGGITAVAISIRAYVRRSSRMEDGWSAAVAYTVPFVLCGCGVAIYNYARFGNPFEFGLRYLLAGDVAQQRLRLSWENLAVGLYYFVLSPPDVNLVFPWFRLAMRIPFGLSNYSFPKGYFIEPMAGAMFVAPFAFALILPVREECVKFVRTIVVASAVAIILFLAATGFSTQRYLIDFVPLLAFGATLTLAAYMGTAGGRVRAIVGGLVCRRNHRCGCAEPRARDYRSV